MRLKAISIAFVLLLLGFTPSSADPVYKPPLELCYKAPGDTDPAGKIMYGIVKKETSSATGVPVVSDKCGFLKKIVVDETDGKGCSADYVETDDSDLKAEYTVVDVPICQSSAESFFGSSTDILGIFGCQA